MMLHGSRIIKVTRESILFISNPIKAAPSQVAHLSWMFLLIL